MLEKFDASVNDLSAELSPEEIIKQAKEYISQGEQEKLKSLYVRYSDKLKNYLENLGYNSIKGHAYSGYNLFYLMLCREKGVYGTFSQLKEAGYKIRTGEKGLQLQAPIFKKEIGEDGKEKEKIIFFKNIYVFALSQCDKLETKETLTIKKEYEKRN